MARRLVRQPVRTLAEPYRGVKQSACSLFGRAGRNLTRSLLRPTDGRRLILPSAMQKHRYAPGSIVCRHQTRFFDIVGGDAITRHGERAGLRSIVSRRVVERTVPSPEEDGKVGGLEVDDGYVGDMVA